ncbi:MAG TPA: manganese efflux pump MntP family protein [Kofleriaceae bacterium]
MWSAVALAFGLAMDATAVSAARGLAGHRPRERVLLPLLFGGFQSGMAALGWLAGLWAGPYIARWDHWVAFGLLVAIGGKMLLDAWRDGKDDGDERAPAPTTIGEARSQGVGTPTALPSGRGTAPPVGSIVLYLGLAIATSIDAAAAGITLPLVPAAPWLSLTLIGSVTAACSATGYVAGRFVGQRFGARLAMLGGLVLIGIGTSLLVRAL